MDYMIQAREEEITVNRGLIYHYEEILKEEKAIYEKSNLIDELKLRLEEIETHIEKLHRELNSINIKKFTHSLVFVDKEIEELLLERNLIEY